MSTICLRNRFLIAMCVAGIGLALCSYGYAQPEGEMRILDLRDCLNLAIQHSPEVTISLEDVQLSLAEEKQREAQFYPSANVDVSYGSIERDRTDPGDENTLLESGLTVRQPLFTFGRLNSDLRSAQASTKHFHSELAENRHLVQAEVINNYFALLMAKEIMRIREEAVRLAEAHLEKVRGFFQLTALKKVSLLRAEVFLQSLQIQSVNAVYTVDDRKNRLRVLMGIPQKEDFDIAGATIGGEIHGQFASDLLGPIADNHPLLDKYRYDILSKQEQINSLEASRYPQIGFFARYERRDEIFDFDETLQPEDEWNVGLTLGWDLFDLFTAQYERSRIEAQARAVDGEAELARDQIRETIDNQRNNIALLQKQIDYYAKLKEMLEESYDLVEQGYYAGVYGHLEWESTFRQLEDARIQLAIARRNLEKSRLLLLWATGNSLAGPQAPGEMP